MDANNAQHWQVWQTAAKQGAIDLAIRALYRDLDAAVVERGPVCNTSGRCCRFEEYGHRLYVTGLEIAWFMQAVGSRESGVGKASASSDVSLNQFAPATSHHPPATPDACPYQIDGLCSVHAIRPLGCRVFFCEAGTEDWQQDTTERFLNRLKALHAEHGLPYAYMEWRMGLAEASKALAPSP